MHVFTKKKKEDSVWWTIWTATRNNVGYCSSMLPNIRFCTCKFRSIPCKIEFLIFMHAHLKLSARENYAIYRTLFMFSLKKLDSDQNEGEVLFFLWTKWRRRSVRTSLKARLMPFIDEHIRQKIHFMSSRETHLKWGPKAHIFIMLISSVAATTLCSTFRGCNNAARFTSKR